MPAETQLRGYFERVDANKSGTITPAELQKALVNGNGTEFNMVTIDSMISLFDKDKSGEICYTEFGALWRYVVDWQNCFKAFDKYGHGHFYSYMKICKTLQRIVGERNQWKERKFSGTSQGR